MDPLHVFISSTWIDMLAERAAVEGATVRLRSIRFVGMEHFGARDANTHDISLEEVDRCQIYVGVIGHRWGSGITQAEYRRAVARGLPCLIYQKADSADGSAPVAQPADDAARLAAWQQELHGRHTVAHFGSAAELAARVVADLHNLVFDRLVVQGIGRVHADYESRIQRFLAEYVGAADAPVPFGGRGGELGELDRWLATDGAPPYLMLGGPAGRGKSALLVHWARQLAQAQPELALVYFPISIRFRTNLAAVALSSITARLAALHGEPLLAGPETPAEVWRELMAAALRRPLPDGRRLLVLLDGADEGADWQPGADLFPATPPPGLRVLVAARYLAGDVDARGWIGRLGWDRPRLARAVDLPPLTPGGLVDVLRQTSLPLDALSARADVVAELFRLSAGDPLLVQLYVSDLWTRGDEVARLQPEDLASLGPGLEGYFGRWWDDQRMQWGELSPLREPAVNAMLNTLACALGPLRAAELLELMPDGDAVALWALDDVVRSLRRFIVGDGAAQGYAFSHPRLGDFFYERLDQAGRAREQDLRFVAWGRRCLDELAAGQRAAADVPGYLLYFLRAHFERAACPAEAYLGLAGNAWALAWERVDKGSFAGYLADLRRVREILARENDQHAARGAPVPFVAAELRATLAAASVAAQAAEMSAPLLAALVQRGAWSPTQAIAYASRMPLAQQRLRCGVALVAACNDADRPLALAAALAELRALPIDDSGARTLRLALNELLVARDGVSPPMRPLAIVGALLRLARQGLDGAVRDRLMHAVHDAVREHPGADESQAEVWALLAPAAGAQASPPRDDLLRRLAAPGHRADPAMAARRLALLQPQVAQGDKPAVLGALVAAAQMAQARITCAAEPNEATVLALVAAWPLLPADVMLHSVAALGAQPASLPVHSVLTAIAAWPQPQRAAEALHGLLLQRPADERAAVAQALLDVLARAPAHGTGAMRQLARAAAALSPGELAARWPAITVALAPDDAIVFCGELLRLRGADAARNPIVALALQAAAALATPVQRAEVIALLLDTLLPPGFTDPFEDWRPTQPGGPLRMALRQVLQIGQVPSDRSEALLQQLAAAAHAEPAGAAAAAACLGPLAAAGDPARVAAPAQPPGPPETDAPGAGQLAAEVDERAQAQSLAAGLALLHDAAGRVPGPTLREAVAWLLQGWIAHGVGGSAVDDLVQRPGQVVAGPLWPPAPGTLAALVALVLGRGPAAIERLLFDTPMPQAVREPLLAEALASARFDDEPDALAMRLPGAVARLLNPPESLVTLALTTLQRWRGMPGHAHTEALEALLPALQRPTLPRWLEAAAQAPEVDLARWLDRLRDQGLLDDAAHGQWLVDAVAQLAPRQQADWLVTLTGLPLVLPLREATAVANALPDAHERLRVLCALLPLRPRAQRADALVDALQLATRLGDRPQKARTLVQLAVDHDPGAPTLMAAATEAAIAIGDHALRGDALACVVAVLPAEAAATAATSSRRVGDMAPRLRALRALAQACSTDRAVADAAVLKAIAALPLAHEQAAATLYAAALQPVPQRWAAMAAAMPAPGERLPGFAPGEIVDALADALHDAPARLQASALDWLRSLGPSPRRSAALLRLLPSLSPGACLAAWVQFGEAGDDDRLQQRARHLFTQAERDTLVALAERGPAAPRRRLPAWLHARRPSAFAPPDPDALCAALAAARDDVARATAWRGLALAQPLNAAHRQALLDALPRIGDALLRTAALRCMAALAPVRALARATAAVAAIEPAGERALASLRLAQRQNGRVRERLIDTALTAALAEPDAVLRVRAAIDCAHAAPALLPPVLAAIGRLPEPELRLQALCTLWHGLPDEPAAPALPAGMALLDDDLQVCWLAEIGVAAGARQRTTMGPLIDGLRHATGRARVLAAVLPRADDAERAAWLARVDAIEVDAAHLSALAAAVQRWPEALDVPRARRAAAMLQALGDDTQAAAWLRAMVPVWPAEAWPEGALALGALASPATVCELLCRALALQPDAPALRETAAALHAPDLRALAQGVAASCCDPPDLHWLGEVIDGLRNEVAVQRAVATCAAIARAAQRVPPPLFDALMAGWAVRPHASLQAWRDVACWLDADQALAVLAQRPWAALPGLVHECADLLHGLAGVVPDDALPRCFEAAAALGSARRQAELLCAWAPRIAGEAAEQAALAAALAVPAESARAQALIGLAGRLAPPRQQQVLQALVCTPRQVERWRRLGMLRPALHAQVHADWRAAAAGLRDPEATASLSALDQQLVAAQMSATTAAPTAAAAAAEAAFDAALERLLDALPPPPALAPPRPPARAPAAAAAAAANVLADLLERLARMQGEDDRVDAIVQRLPQLGGAAAVALVEALPQLLGPARHDQLLPALGARLAAADRAVLARRLAAVAGDLPRFGRLATALRPLFGAADRAALLAVCREGWSGPSAGHRSDMLARLHASAPLFPLLGGDAAAVQLIGAIDDAGRMWP